MPRSLYLQDWNFQHRFLPVHTPAGITQKWAPYGMPRLGYEVQTTVFFLFGRDPKTGELEGPAGTGVFVSRDSSKARHMYAVSARHVIQQGYSCIRLNTVITDGGKDFLTSRVIELDPSEWLFAPNGDDLAAIDVTDLMQAESTVDFVCSVGEDEFVTRKFIDDVELGEGEDAFMVGLFAKNAGGDTNVPAMRFGNIAQLAHDELLIEHSDGTKLPMHVFDMRSRPGYSGSPVFVYRTPDHDLRHVPEENSGHPMVRVFTPDNKFVRFLGIHVGQFDEDVFAKKAESYGKSAIYDGDKLTVPGSMTVVIPAWRISDLLDIPQFKEPRKMREKREAKTGKPKFRAEVAEAVPESGNPSHKEDFTRLLGAAARANKPAP